MNYLFFSVAFQVANLKEITGYDLCPLKRSMFYPLVISRNWRNMLSPHHSKSSSGVINSRDTFTKRLADRFALLPSALGKNVIPGENSQQIDVIPCLIVNKGSSGTLQNGNRPFRTSFLVFGLILHAVSCANILLAGWRIVKDMLSSAYHFKESFSIMPIKASKLNAVFTLFWLLTKKNGVRLRIFKQSW